MNRHPGGEAQTLHLLENIEWKKEMARGAKNARQEDRFLNEIISLFVLNARKSKNALNAKIIEVIPNEISIAFLSLLK